MYKEYTELDITVVKETAKAILADTGDEEIWIPKSLIEDYDYPGEEDSGTIYVEGWWADNNL